MSVGVANTLVVSYFERSDVLKKQLEHAREMEHQATVRLQESQNQIVDLISRGTELTSEQQLQLEVLEAEYPALEAEWKARAIALTEVRARVRDLIEEQRRMMPGSLASDRPSSPTHTDGQHVLEPLGFVPTLYNSKAIRRAADELTSTPQRLIQAAYPDVPHSLRARSIPIADDELRAQFDTMDLAGTGLLPPEKVQRFFELQEDYGVPLRQDFVHSQLAGRGSVDFDLFAVMYLSLLRR